MDKKDDLSFDSPSFLSRSKFLIFYVTDEHFVTDQGTLKIKISNML